MSKALKTDYSEAIARSNYCVDVISKTVQKVAGIQLGPRQSNMVQARVTKRMLELGIPDFDAYLKFLNANMDSEVEALVSLLTTHHTYFFREYPHFEFLEQTILPNLIIQLRKEHRKKIKVWTAACSRGQETYSLSMFLNVYLKKNAPEFTYEIVGSDIDRESVKIAKNGVYNFAEIKEIPSHFLANHWARGTGDIAEFVKAKSSIRSSCRFETLNLFEIPDTFAEKFDLIFCRNVFIYFNLDQTKQVTKTLMTRLENHGILFVGLSESLGTLQLPLDLVGPSAYAHKGYANNKENSKVVSLPRQLPIKVFCIDDSSTILTLLGKILTKDSGFEIIGTATDGLQASEALKKLKPDVITLDIHMPNQNGIEYLEKNMSETHPPVVIVSSVSREDADLGLKTLELGASDYIEKPALSNMDLKTDEIRSKLRCLVQSRLVNGPRKIGLEKSFGKRNIPVNPDKKLRIVVASPGDLKKLESLMSVFQGPHPATFLLFKGGGNLIPALIRQLKTGSWKKVWNLEETALAPGTLNSGDLYFGDLEKHAESVAIAAQDKSSVGVILGDVSRSHLASSEKIPQVKWVVEDLGFLASNHHQALKRKARYFVPAASAAYHMDELLAAKSEESK